LRTPSEVVGLRWEHVNWDQKRLTVMSPKTSGQGKPWRVMPLFPELQVALNEVLELAPEGSEFIINRYRDRAANLRTQFARILKRAGVEPWPRLFQNLRASRQTELANLYPLHVITSWLGNTPKVAQRHYLTTTDDHFRRAVDDVGGETGGAIKDEVVQQVVLSASDTRCQEMPQATEAVGVTPNIGTTPESYEKAKAPRAGFEPATC